VLCVNNQHQIGNYCRCDEDFDIQGSDRDLHCMRQFRLGGMRLDESQYTRASLYPNKANISPRVRGMNFVGVRCMENMSENPVSEHLSFSKPQSSLQSKSAHGQVPPCSKVDEIGCDGCSKHSRDFSKVVRPATPTHGPRTDRSEKQDVSRVQLRDEPLLRG
jgi:hypothetical protein